ncbi:MAG: hypothetical protein ABJD11_11880 [Gemmatimonadota bacterium]
MPSRPSWRTLEPLIDEALDLSPAERLHWLADLASRSPTLAEAVSALLNEEDRADSSGFLTGTPEVTLAGLELGAYRLVRQLGEGGMGGSAENVCARSFCWRRNAHWHSGSQWRR